MDRWLATAHQIVRLFRRLQVVDSTPPRWRGDVPLEDERGRLLAYARVVVRD